MTDLTTIQSMTRPQLESALRDAEAQVKQLQADLETARWAIGAKDRQLNELVAHVESLEGTYGRI